MDTAHGRTWAEISLDNLEHNYRALRGLLKPGCGFVGVVKADAYGHGALPVARRLEELGAEYLAVACLEEGAALRRGGITAPILILGATPPEEAEEVVELGLTQTVFEPALAKALSDAAGKLGKRAVVHLKVDTGMSRLGCPAYDAPACAAALAALCALPGVEAEGIYTHFAAADDDQAYTMDQLARFERVIGLLREEYGISFKFRHCAASAAVLHYPCTHMDLVRPGIALYGHAPDPGCPLPPEGLRPVMALKTRVAAVRELPAGVGVSYGHTAWTGEEGCRLAVLPIGYADGLPRLLSGRGVVELGGALRPITGRVCMDMCMVRLEPGDKVAPGDVAVVYGGEAGVERAAQAVGTISYELLCAVSRRVPRILTDA